MRRNEHGRPPLHVATGFEQVQAIRALSRIFSAFGFLSDRSGF